jgi:hypothetical protein
MGRTIRLVALLALLLGAVPAAAQNRVPSPNALESLVKATLLTFNDANVTGNYAVFHAKLSKPFRDQFPVERLEKVFAEFRTRQIDVDSIAALKPAYDPAPAVNDDGWLVVRGRFPTEPLQLDFSLEFIPSDGEWKLIGINVKTVKP